MNITTSTENSRGIQPGDTVSDAAVARVTNGVISHSLPKSEWTHGAHLCVATAILRKFGLDEALRIMPNIIRTYNESTGVRNTDTSGYHHTLTVFYLRAIHRSLASRWLNSLGTLATLILQSEIANRDYPLRFYSKDQLFSVDARRGWVAATGSVSDVN